MIMISLTACASLVIGLCPINAQWAITVGALPVRTCTRSYGLHGVSRNAVFGSRLALPCRFTGAWLQAAQSCLDAITGHVRGLVELVLKEELGRFPKALNAVR